MIDVASANLYEEQWKFREYKTFIEFLGDKDLLAETYEDIEQLIEDCRANNELIDANNMKLEMKMVYLNLDRLPTEHLDRHTDEQASKRNQEILNYIDRVKYEKDPAQSLKEYHKFLRFDY